MDYGIERRRSRMALGVVSYVVVMVCRRRAALVDPALYALAVVFILMLAPGAI